MTGTAVLLSPFQDPVAIRNPSPPRATRTGREDRTPGSSAPAPGFPGPSRGRARECAPDAGRRGRRGRAGRRPGAQFIIPPLTREAATVRRARATKRAATVAVVAARAPVAAATRARPSPAAQPGVTLPLPAVRPAVPEPVRRSHEPQRKDAGVSSWSGQVLSEVRGRTWEKSRGGSSRSRR